MSHHPQKWLQNRLQNVGFLAFLLAFLRAQRVVGVLAFLRAPGVRFVVVVVVVVIFVVAVVEKVSATNSQVSLLIMSD